MGSSPNPPYMPQRHELPPPPPMDSPSSAAASFFYAVSSSATMPFLPPPPPSHSPDQTPRNSSGFPALISSQSLPALSNPTREHASSTASSTLLREESRLHFSTNQDEEKARSRANTHPKALSSSTSPSVPSRSLFDAPPSPLPIPQPNPATSSPSGSSASPSQEEAAWTLTSEGLQKDLRTLLRQSANRNDHGELENLENLLENMLAEVRTVKRDSLLCIVCMDARRACIVLPCAHTSTCFDCGWKLDQCPECRAVISQRVQVFI
eukprot:gb/GEZN01006488.1/.p1 GENE.gb/GEZN01006488.1/~~gb/GEZN01006488.1/.p1  ORF type:complete len:266 (-),score=42.59 gb/GEZN01006488.1/:26-823(-)